MAAQHSTNPYSHTHEVRDDGSVLFQCSQDTKANTWLALPPHHAVVVQTQSFWTAVGAGTALRGWEETKWTALTWIEWELRSASGGHATHGVYRQSEEEGKLGYTIELFNAEGASVVVFHGRGVVFRNRNFEAWREGSKIEARNAAPRQDFAFAKREELGLV